MANPKQQALKKYDVFHSYILFDRNYPLQWKENFLVIGEILAFNSVHAIVNAKKKFPASAGRIAVIAANHSSSPTSHQRLVINNFRNYNAYRQEGVAA